MISAEKARRFAFGALATISPMLMLFACRSKRLSRYSSLALGAAVSQVGWLPLPPTSLNKTSAITRLCFQHLRLRFRHLPYLTWPNTCANSTWLMLQNDPTLSRLRPTLLPFQKQSPDYLCKLSWSLPLPSFSRGQVEYIQV